MSKTAQREADAKLLADLMCDLIDRCVEFHRVPYQHEREHLAGVIVEVLANAESRAVEP